MNATLDLQREAARVGPGYRGRRKTVPAEILTELREQFRASGLDAAAFLHRPAEWVERRAKLFEVGHFPDKGVTVTPETLATLAENFDLPVPVLIEHAESPLEMGYLTDVEHEGNELFGTITLTAEADALVERSAAKSLSLGLNKELTEIREVSLVRHARIESARLFSEIRFVGRLEDGWRERFRELEAAHRHEAAERTAQELMRSGRLLPSQLPFAVALLDTTDAIEFDGESIPIARLFLNLVEARPATALFEELAPTAPRSDFSHALMLPEEAEFYRRYFPGISLDQIAAKRGATIGG